MSPAQNTSFVRDAVEIVDLEARAYNDLDKAAYLRGFVRGPLVASGRKSARVADLEIKLRPRTVIRCLCHRVDVSQCATALAGEAIRVESVPCDPRLTIRRVEAQ